MMDADQDWQLGEHYKTTYTRYIQGIAALLKIHVPPHTLDGGRVRTTPRTRLASLLVLRVAVRLPKVGVAKAVQRVGSPPQ